MRTVETDVLVVGSGAAGMLAALACAATCDVMLVSKGPLSRDGATITAQADIAVDGRACRAHLGLDGDPSDSPARFAEDMLREGGYLGDEALIALHTEAAGREVKRLADMGLKLRGLVHNPGHAVPRSVWVSARELCAILRRRVEESAAVVRQYTLAVDLLLQDGEAVGALLLDRLTGERCVVSAKRTILCTGGGMRLYPHATAPRGLTGDGLAMAYRAGATLSEMEFPMFLPYALLRPQILEGVTFTHDLTMLTQAHALNRAGERYMRDWDPVRMERSTRDVNAAAAGAEIAAGRGTPHGGVWVSLAHLPANLIEELGNWLPEGLSGWRYGGFDLKKLLPDLARDALETLPCSHFWNGGIVVDASCHTTVPGLLAGGEGIAGLHGANRISGNGLTQAIVWGARAGRAAAAEVKREAKAHREVAAFAYAGAEARIREVLQISRKKTAPAPPEIARAIREAAWQDAGLVRNEAGLLALARTLDDLAAQLPAQRARSGDPAWNVDLAVALENASMMDVARMTAAAALSRRESRGAHYRADFPFTDEAWDVNLHIRMRDGAPTCEAATANNACARESRRRKAEGRSLRQFQYGSKERATSEDQNQRS